MFKGFLFHFNSKVMAICVFFVSKSDGSFYCFQSYKLIGISIQSLTSYERQVWTFVNWLFDEILS